jgi:hypothetical protein
MLPELGESVLKDVVNSYPYTKLYIGPESLSSLTRPWLVTDPEVVERSDGSIG